MVDRQLMSSARSDWRTPIEMIKIVSGCSWGHWWDLCDGSPELYPKEFMPIGADTPAGTRILKPGKTPVLYWQNPPYGRDAKRWSVEWLRVHGDKLALVPARTETAWFSRYLTESSAVLFVGQRLKFDDGPTGAPFPSAVFARGPLALHTLRRIQEKFDGHVMVKI